MSNHNHKKFTGRLTKEELAEIFILTQTEVLVEGLALHNGHFVRLVYADDKQKDAAVKCTHCQRFFGNFPENYNTIRFHMKNCKGTDDPIIVPRHFKEALLKELAHLCAADGLSFSQATGPGLTNTFDFIYKQGYLHGRNIAINNIVSSAVPSIKDSVPDRRAVSTFVKDFVDANKPDFDEFVVKNIRSYGGACAIDLTTKSGVHFMGITVHFLSEKWEHHAYLLDIREYDENKSDAVALAGFIKNVLLSHGLTNDDIKKIIFAIDEGSNLNAALHDHMTVNCSCHICHLVGYHAVEPYSEGYLPNDPDIHVDPDTREKLAAVRETLDFTKKIIKGVNSRPHLQNALARVLFTEGPTCWLSLLTSIRRFMELSEDEFHTISIELSKSDTYVEALQDVTNNKHILQDFVDALSPLDPVLKLLEAENYTTINRVLLEFQELKDHFYMLQTDESWVKKAIGIAAYKALQFKQRLCNDVQMLGLMLDPLLKDDITKLSDIDIDAATNMMIQKVKELFISTPDLYARLAPSPYRTGRNPHPGIDPIDVEVRKYLEVISSFDERQTFPDCLSFWRQRESEFPHVSKLAHWILSVPASSASTERQFSILNRESPDNRQSLNQTTLSNLVFMISLEKFLKYIESEEG